MFDWQFLIVTLIALGAGGIVLRRLLPARKVQAKGADAPAVPASAACAHCAAGESHPQNLNPNARRNVRPPSFPGAHAG
jgi:hypothetical protein